MRRWWYMAAVGIVAAMIAFAALGQRRKPAPNADAPKMRIVSLAPAITEMLFELGLGDSIVGVVERSDYPLAALKIERVGGFATPNLEKVLSLRPTLVVGETGARDDVLKITRESGAEVLLIRVGGFEAMFATLIEIGKATDTTPRAKQLVAAMQAQLDEIAGRYENVPREQRPRVFIEFWNDPLMTAGGPSFIDDMIARAGGINVAHGINERSPRISSEIVVEWDPDVIISASMAAGAQTAKDFAKRVGWENIAAVKSGRVISDIEIDHLLTPGPRLIKGVRELAERLHPDVAQATGPLTDEEERIPYVTLGVFVAIACAISAFIGATTPNSGRTFALAAFLVIVCIVSVFIGAADLDFSKIRGPDFQWGIFYMRVARILLAVVAGAGLSVAGVIFQALLRNPLAEPYVLGVSSGAGLGSAMAIVLGLSALGMWTLPAMAFAGALGTIILVYMLARTPGGAVPVHTLLLSGVIVSAVFSSLLMFMVYASDSKEIHGVVWWLLGNLQINDWALLRLAAVVVAGGVMFTMLYARDLNVMTLGEQPATHLGLHPERTKKLFFVVASLMTGAAVATCGLIGFVGLIVPHAVRLAIGPDHRRLIPTCALAGAAFLVVADAFARVALAPTEIPIGVVTAFLGGPFFLFLLRRRKRSYWS